MPSPSPAAPAAPAAPVSEPKADIESEAVKLKALLPTKDIVQVVSFIGRSDSSFEWPDIWQDAKQKGYAFTTSEAEYYGANHAPTIKPAPAELDDRDGYYEHQRLEREYEMSRV